VDSDGKIRRRLPREDVDVDGANGDIISFRPGIVHRLDKGTTGVLIVAKTTQALAAR
jgi:23S rRNA-/tRNA-specific pseudouridylate synthase